MRNYRLLTPVLLGLVAIAGSMPAAMAAAPDVQIAAPSPGTARVWFLRPTSSADGNVWGSSPMIYANCTPVAEIPPNADFYRDFAPGTYSFSVDPYSGVPTNDANTVQLAPGTQTYLEVQWVSTWEMGYASGGRGDQSHSFFVLNMAPQLAQAYLPTLDYLGQH